MPYTVKPIETIYNGYRFRSRLEARWAVFFDEIKYPYQYELEGFEADGERYLPDFYLPDIDGWFEVKAVEPKDYEWKKIKAISHGQRIIIAIGECRPDKCEIAICVCGEIRRNISLWACPRCAGIALKGGGEEEGDTGIVCFRCEYTETFKGNIPTPEILLAGYHMGAAFEAAIQARFEHGQSPKSNK